MSELIPFGYIIVFGGMAYISFFVFRFLKLYTNIELTRSKEFLTIVFVTIISIPAMTVLSLYAIIYFHMLFISIVLEILYILLKKFKLYKKVFTTGLASTILTACVFTYGYYNMNRIVRTEYNIVNDKIDALKILQISDLHMGNSINTDRLRQYCDNMSNEQPDIVFLTGDIFDENTSKLEMEEAAEILGSIDNSLGIYYIYGNHDLINKNFDSNDIRSHLEKFNIIVLDDEVTMIENITIVGRRDVTYHEAVGLKRKTAEQMLGEVDANTYIIVLDHQPVDVELNAKFGADLQLSGHTHGGQIFPLGMIESFVTNGLVYGEKVINNFHAITSSGIAGWGYPIKTGAPSEYVIININY